MLKFCGFVVGSISTVIFWPSWIATLLFGGVGSFCFVMRILDNGPVDHYWNCGVVIYGFRFLIAAAIASVSFIFAQLKA